MPRIDGDLKRIGEWIRRSRYESGMGLKEFAQKAGLSESTVKNAEGGNRPTSIGTVRKIEKLCGQPFNHRFGIFPMDMKLALVELRSHDPLKIQEQMHLECNKNNGIIPFLNLQTSDKYLAYYYMKQKQKGYKDQLDSKNVAISKIANIIDKIGQRNHLHVICLTCGHGWHELQLAKAIAQRTDSQVIVSLVHPSRSLLTYGINQAATGFTDAPNLSVFAYTANYETICTDLLLDKDPSLWKRVICIFDTMDNYDYQKQLLDFLYNIALETDLLIFDTLDRFNKSDDEHEILKKDVALNGEWPSTLVSLTDQSIQQTVLEYLPQPASISITRTLLTKKHLVDTLADYAIDLRATIDNGITRPWQISGMRVYRYSNLRVVRALDEMGWRLVSQETWGKEVVPAQVSRLNVFSKRVKKT